MCLFNKQSKRAVFFLTVLVGPFAWIAICYAANRAIVAWSQTRNQSRALVAEAEMSAHPKNDPQQSNFITTGPSVANVASPITNVQRFATVIAKITSAQATLGK